MVEDHKIIEEIQGGKPEEFAHLVTKYQRMAMRLAFRLTRDLALAEDVVQESFLKAFQKLDSFEGRSSFKSWLYQITLNTGRNKLRKIRPNHIEVGKLSLAVPSVAESGVDHKTMSSHIREEVARLPRRQQEALNLRIFDDLSFKEIALIMKCPYDTAKANYRHAIMKLRHVFETDDKLKLFKNMEVRPMVAFQFRHVEVES